MSEPFKLVKIVHEDGSIIEGTEPYDEGEWITRSGKYCVLYRAREGWREVKPEPVDVTGECLIQNGGQSLEFPPLYRIYHLTHGYKWKKEQAIIVSEELMRVVSPKWKKEKTTTVLRIMKEGG